MRERASWAVLLVVLGGFSCTELMTRHGISVDACLSLPTNPQVASKERRQKKKNDQRWGGVGDDGPISVLDKIDEPVSGRVYVLVRSSVCVRVSHIPLLQSRLRSGQRSILLPIMVPCQRNSSPDRTCRRASVRLLLDSALALPFQGKGEEMAWGGVQRAAQSLQMRQMQIDADVVRWAAAALPCIAVRYIDILL